MANLLPDVEATATHLARVLRLHSSDDAHEPSITRASVVRRLLEELGVHCDETAALQDLKGFLLSSRRGTEIVTCKDLSDEERVQVYAHLVAHTLLDPDLDDLQLLARFEYMPGRAPDSQSAHEERLADAVAQAILDGRLEAAPRLVYCHDLGSGRGRLSRAVLRGLHQGSLALYRRSRSYQRLRSLRMFTAVTLRVHSFLGNAA